MHKPSIFWKNNYISKFLKKTITSQQYLGFSNKNQKEIPS